MKWLDKTKIRWQLTAVNHVHVQTKLTRTDTGPVAGAREAGRTVGDARVAAFVVTTLFVVTTAVLACRTLVDI